MILDDKDDLVVPDDRDEDDTTDAIHAARASRPLPWREAAAASLLVLVHLAVGLEVASGRPLAGVLLERGGLVRGVTLEEPWRLLTSLFVHADASHALWNGLSMLVFAVPLLADLGYTGTALVYLAAGIGGGLAALAFTAPGTIVIGSSGAVAGLFGAWIVLSLRYSSRAVLVWRARIRAMGIALLVLPSLLTPTTPEGHPVSVASHVGGLATGMLIGAVISVGLLADGQTSGPATDGPPPANP